jgi:hypothetical protein
LAFVGIAPPTKMSASGNPAVLSRRATASATGVVAPVVKPELISTISL